MISNKIIMLRCFKTHQFLHVLNKQNSLSLSRLCFEHTKVISKEEKVPTPKEKLSEPPPKDIPIEKSTIVSKAFATISDLKPSKAPSVPKKKKIDPIESLINNAKDVETLLAAVDTDIINRKYALKVLSTLTDWSSNDKIKLQDFETDTRFIRLCRVLGRPIKSKDEPETLGDLSVVLGVTGDDEAAKLISSIQLPQMIKILSALGSKKKRSTPLLRSLAFNIGRSNEKLNIKQGADVFYATAVLNFPDEVLLEKVCADMCEAIPSNTKPAVIGSLTTSMGILRYRNTELLEQICHWIEKHWDVCRIQDVVAIVLTLARVNYSPSNKEELFKKITSSLTPAEVGDNSTWLDIVWSYNLLGHFSAPDTTAYVLAKEFIESFTTQSETGNVAAKMKLINVNAAAKYMIANYSGPVLDESSSIFNTPLIRSREKQALVTVVIDSLINLVPALTHLRTNVNSGIGFLIDAEFFVDSKKNPVPLDKSEKAHRVAVVTLDYHDLCRGTHNQLNGISAFNIAILQKQGYSVICVPHTEFSRKDKLVTRVKYLENKIKELDIK